jgi:hypothetical protein
MHRVKAPSLRHILFGCFIATFCVAMTEFSHAGDEQWGHEFFNPLVGQASLSPFVVGAIAIAPDGRVIYGGPALDSDQGPAQVVALSGTQRTALAPAAGRALIYAIAVNGTNIYIGGDFKGLSGCSVTNLAKWDGSTGWLGVGGGVSGGPVLSIAIKDGSLYVGGGFTNAGGLAVKAIASWNGVNWNDLGGGMHLRPAPFPNPAPIPAVRAMQFIGDRLYVGGNFDSAGGVVATNIAEFSSGSWKALISGTNNGVIGPDWPSDVHALAVNSTGELIVGGAFTQAGDVAANFVAKWTGSTWEALGLGLNRPSIGSVDALYCQGTDIYSGGKFVMLEGVWTDGNHRGFARWNGTNWVTVDLMTQEGMTAITGDGTNIFAAAPAITPALSGPVAIIKGHSNDWSVLGGGIQIFSTPIHTIATTGAGLQINGPIAGSIIEWDGKRWTNTGSGLNGAIEKLARANGVTYAVGSFSAAIGGATLNGIGGWDGTNWFNLGEGLPSAGLSILTNGTNIIVGHQSGIQQWNGTTWSNIGDGLPGEVHAIAVDGDAIFAGGSFTEPGITNIARWMGDGWKPLGSGLNGMVRAMAMINHKLYAVGDFTATGSATLNNIAAWDGVSWSDVNGGVSFGYNATTIYAIEPDPVGGFFVGGDFQQAGGKVANFVAHWTGDHWETMGSGLNGPAQSLATDGEDLYVVGNFAFAGGHSSLQIARYRLSGLTLSPLGLSSEGAFSLDVRGLFPNQFILQQSSDLIDWTNIATNMFAPPRAQLTVPSSQSGASFFRLACP